jgi:hypothetical protein
MGPLDHTLSLPCISILLCTHFLTSLMLHFGSARSRVCERGCRTLLPLLVLVASTRFILAVPCCVSSVRLLPAVGSTTAGDGSDRRASRQPLCVAPCGCAHDWGVSAQATRLPDLEALCAERGGRGVLLLSPFAFGGLAHGPRRNFRCAKPTWKRRHEICEGTADRSRLDPILM